MNIVIHRFQSKNKAIQSSALTGLGMAARSTCDAELRQICLDRARMDETATAAIRALGMVFLGSGLSNVFGDIYAQAELYHKRPRQGKKYRKSLAACYRATGLIYLGTGSMDPLDFLLDMLALPRTGRVHMYQSAAAKALVMMEFPEAKLGWTFIDPSAKS